MPDHDPYFKRQLDYTIDGETLQFNTAALLSSAHEIDRGADVLLHTLLPHLKQQPPAAILDLGCGYGTLGLTLAKHIPTAHVTLTDKDLLASRYTTDNAKLNGLKNVSVRAGLGVRGIPMASFDVIVTDLPTKIGDRAIEYDFVLGPLALLRPQGSYWIVSDSQINRLMPNLARKHQFKLHEVLKRKGKIVYTVQAKH